MYTALKHHWKCNGDCQPGSHEAYLNLGGAAISVGLDVMFPLRGGASAPCQILRQVRIVPAELKPAASVSDISHVHQSSLLASVQQTFIQENTAARNQNLRTTLRLGPPSIRSSFKAKFGTKTQLPLGLEKSVKFGPLTVSVTPVASPDTTPSCTPDPSVQSASPQLIEDLCLFLANDQVKSGAFEVGMDSYFRRNKLDPGHHGVAADKLQLVTLPDLVEAHSYGLITISRQTSMRWPPTLPRPYSKLTCPRGSRQDGPNPTFSSWLIRIRKPFTALAPCSLAAFILRHRQLPAATRAGAMLWTTLLRAPQWPPISRLDNCHQMKKTPVHPSSPSASCSWNVRQIEGCLYPLSAVSGAVESTCAPELLPTHPS